MSVHRLTCRESITAPARLARESAQNRAIRAGTAVAHALTRHVADILTRNLHALRARTGQEPVLGLRGGVPRILIAEDADAARARLQTFDRGARPATIFLVGCCGDAFLDAIAERYPATQVIIFEPDPAAAARLLETRDWSERIGAGLFAVFVGPDYQGASGFWRPTDLSPARLVIVDPDVARVLPDETAKAESLVDRLIDEARANADARRAHAARYVLHTLANSATIAREGDVASLSDAFSSPPALIVGAGPSLDGRLAEIARIADRVIVIACAAAARPLLAAQITPRFIVSVDPTEAHAAHVVGLQARGAWLVAEGSVHPTALAAFDRRIFTFNVSDHHPWPWLRSLGLDRGRLATWGSATTSALDLALGMGCGSILFAGVDFAFVGGRPNCRGTTLEPQWAVAMNHGQTVDDLCRDSINRWPMMLEPDVDGHLVRTAPHLVSFRNYLRQQFEAASHVRFMNVTPGGILHHRFVEQCTPEEAIGVAPVLDHEAIGAELRTRHRRSAGTVTPLFRGIDGLLAQSREVVRPPLDAWSQFVGPTVRPDVFMAALRSHEYDAWSRGRTSAPAGRDAAALSFP